MNDDEKQEALENIELIKEIVTRTKKEMTFGGGGWIAIVWGIFALVGVSGQRFFIPPGMIRGIWWTTLTIIAAFATYFVFKIGSKYQPKKETRFFVKKFLMFWIPLMILGYTLIFFCIFHPDLSPQYIPIVILLVVSTGYLIIGFLFTREILFMAITGYIGTVLTAIFFIKYADIILSALFGFGLILTGWISLYKGRVK